MNYHERMEAILAADAARRAERDAIPVELSDAYRIAHAPKDATANGCLVKPIGVVSTHKVRYSERWMTSAEMPQDELPDHTVGGDVTVYKDGNVTVVPATSFRKTREYTRKSEQRTQAAHVPEAAKIHLDHNFND